MNKLLKTIRTIIKRDELETVLKVSGTVLERWNTLLMWADGDEMWIVKKKKFLAGSGMLIRIHAGYDFREAFDIWEKGSQ